MNININLGNTQENITSEIILKLYLIATAADNTVTLSGNLYSPSGYAYQVDYLNTQFAPNLTITVPDNGKYIYFEDSFVEDALKSGGFSSDGIGISVNDANTAVFTQNTFQNNKNITSFDTFDYFTKANINPPNKLFYGTSLNSIDLSQTTAISNEEFCYTLLVDINAPSLLTIGLSAFANCEQLETVTSLGNISAVLSYAFKNTSSLQSVILPQSCNLIGNEAFRNSSISQINLLNIEVLGLSAFSLCNYLQINSLDLRSLTSVGKESLYGTLLTGDINMPNLTYIGESAFRGTKITSVSNLGAITAIPKGCFLWCSQLAQITIPTTVSTIESSAFFLTSITNLIVPFGVTTVISGLFLGSSGNSIRYVQLPSTILKFECWDIFRDSKNRGTTYFIIQANIVIESGRILSNTDGAHLGWGWGKPGDPARWYVLDDIVDDYKSSDLWSPIADSIFPISLLETDNPTMWLLYQDNKDYGKPTTN